MRIGVVFNPKSGTRRGDAIHREIRKAIRQDGHDATFLDVVDGSPLEHALHQMIPEVDALAVVGGDGTLNGVVNGTLTSSRPETPLAFFPAGRGKDTARTIGSFSISMIGTRQIDWQASHRVDVGRATRDTGEHRFFINASDVGLSAAAARMASRLPRQLGSLSYVLGAAYGFAVTRPATARLVFDGGSSLEVDSLLTLAVCNGRSFGGGIVIAPDASADDGQLDIVAVRNANLADLLANLPKLKRGTLQDHPALTRWRAAGVRIERTGLAPIDLDGELWGTVPVTYTVEPRALNWIGPRP